jgi:hypothetical protein
MSHVQLQTSSRLFQRVKTNLLSIFSTKNGSNHVPSCKKAPQLSFSSHANPNFPLANPTKTLPVSIRSPPLSRPPATLKTPLPFLSGSTAKSQNSKSPQKKPWHSLKTRWQWLPCSPGSRINTGRPSLSWYSRRGPRCWARADSRGSCCSLRWLDRR